MSNTILRKALIIMFNFVRLNYKMKTDYCFYLFVGMKEQKLKAKRSVMKIEAERQRFLI